MDHQATAVSVSWKSRFKACRSKLDATVEETKELRRQIRAGVPGWQREVARLRKELSRALTEPLAAESLREERWPTAGRRVVLASVVYERGTQAPPDGAGMTVGVECRYYGRDFTAEEMALLRALISADPPPNRHALSREFCRCISWFKPDGGLKDMMARVTMLAMHKDGLIVLPPPKWPRPARRPMVFGPDTEPPAHPAPTSLDAVRPLDLRPAVRYNLVRKHPAGSELPETRRP